MNVPKMTPKFGPEDSAVEWYCDGLPVDELKRRYAAHDALVDALHAALQIIS